MIKTERFLLRPHYVEDFDLYSHLWTQPEPSDTSGALMLSPEEIWARLLRFVGHWSYFGYGFFIAEDLTSGKIVAEAGLAQFHRNVDPRMEGVPEAGWRVLGNRRGEGIASEVMLAATQWLDSHLAPPRTVCMVHPDNIASMKIASKLGYLEFDRGSYKGKSVIFLQRVP